MSALCRFSPETLGELLPTLQTILRSGRLILGPYTQQFEQEFAACHGAQHGVAVASASAALTILMLALQKREGRVPRGILLPTNTFATVPLALAQAGIVRIYLADIRDTFTMDLELAKKRLTETGASVVIPTHTTGYVDPGLIDFAQWCKARGIVLIEDASHAHGGVCGSQPVGTLGWAGVFSLYATKLVTSGVGGMIVTNDAWLAETARALRHHGGATSGPLWGDGSDWLLSEMAAAVGLASFRTLGENLAGRRAWAAHYGALLATEARVSCPEEYERSTFYKYPLTLMPKADRDGIIEYMTRSGIETGVCYAIPLHRQPGLQRFWLGRGDAKSTFQADALLDHQLCLPLHARMTEPEAAMVVRTLKRALDLFCS